MKGVGLTLAVALGLLWPGAAALAQVPLRAMDWLAPGADVVMALTREPSECLVLPADEAEAAKVRAGRLLFRSPLLLGGQAARHGLTCQACHINGNGNPDFYIEGVSGEPGTVDVTSSIFSEVRGDGIFNPVPIPSLVDAGSRAAYGHAGEEQSLAHFVRSVIMDEFAGHEPGESSFEAVMAYVEALRSRGCPVSAHKRIHLSTYEADIADGVAALAQALRRRDGRLADSLVLALQSRLGDVHERYSGAGLGESADRLADLGRGLAALRAPIREQAADTDTRLENWYRSWTELLPLLREQEDRSLFNQAVLRSVLQDGEGK